MASTDFRLTGLDARGADLTLSTLELHGAGGRLDAGAVITSSHAPIAGALSALGDGDLLTSCTFAAADVASPGFWIGIQLPVAQEVTSVASQGHLYALLLCERLGNSWSFVMSIQDTRGLPALSIPFLWGKSPAVAADLTVFGGITGASPMVPVPSEGGVKFGASGINPAFAKFTASPVMSWVGLRAKLVFKLTRDAASRKHTGFFFPDAGGGAGGYRLAFLDNSFVYSVYQSGLEVIINTTALNAAGPLVDQVHTLDVIVEDGGLVTAYQNDQLLGTLPGRDSRFNYVVGGVFVYGADVEVQHVEISSRASRSGPAATLCAQVLALPQGAPLLPQSSALLQQVNSFGIADLECGGHGCIYGPVELYTQAGNIPLPRRVRLHRSRDGLLVRETWSNAQGNYRFDGISDRYKYDVIAWDHEGLQQSVVANDLTPEPMQ